MPTSAPTQADPVIALDNVTCRFISPTGKATVAMQDFSLTVAKGEFCALVGPTGCGKSTALNLITGLIKPSAGSVRVMGQPVSGIHPSIGFVFQSDAVFPWRSVTENIAAGPVFRGLAKREARALALEWQHKVGLDGFDNHYPHQLSGGMRKRVALAQTFINKPQILLMDEPFSALDMQTRTLMQDELLQLWSVSGGSVVFVTQDFEEAVALADKVVVLSARPARVRSVYNIELPRPRIMSEVRYEAQFIHYANRIWDDLREEVSIA